MPPPALRLILLAAALATLGALGHLLRPTGPPTIDCDLNAVPCRAALGGGELHVSLSPRPIPLMAPVKVDVQLSGTEATAVRFELLGAEMDMGLIRSDLVAVGGGRFTGQVTIPVCVTGRMRWHAVVQVVAREGTASLAFAFETAGGGSEPPTR